jgi:signal transduction histidine kinase
METPREEILAAYREYDREITIGNFKVACVLGMVLMPLGFVLDYMVYRPMAWEFLALRLLSSVLIGLFLGVLTTRFGRNHHRVLGLILLLIPTSFMCVMIARTEGAASPYYAGLNLVLLTIAFVLRWTFRESLVALVLLMALYLAACAAHGPLFPRASGPPEAQVATGTAITEAGEVIEARLRGADGTRVQSEGLFFNNLYFLALTGIIVVTGNHFLGALRLREFTSRYELDRNRRQLEESNRKLKELDRIKSRFFANISHELRTPLTLLLAPLESLLHRRADRLPAESLELLRTMQANGMRLLKLINDLLDLVRLDSGALQIRTEAVGIREMVLGLSRAVAPAAGEKRIGIETTIDPEIRTLLLDRDMTEKALLNLLFNAIKFTPPGGRIQVEAGRHGDRIALRVADTGIGIPKDAQPRVFDRFWQGDASSRRRHQGAGIGLALVRELTEAQGGSVSVESQEGQGTTFTLYLPWRVPETATHTGMAGEPPRTTDPDREVDGRAEWLADLYRRAELAPATPPVRPIAPGPDRSGRAERPVVLIADDEPDMRSFLESELRAEFDLQLAEDGSQAVEKAVRLRPDLVLLDMMMPEKDGLEVCRELRQLEATRNTPVIMVTARVDEETKLAALSGGANDFLLKPFSTAELHARVRNLVSAHQLQKRLARQNDLLTEALQQLREMQSQLVQAEKLSSLGRLSAGIIHEINNPLNFAATGLYALRGKRKFMAVEEQGDYEETLKDIEEGINRVRNIVSDLRTFTFPNAASTDDVRLVDAVEMAKRFLSHEWDANIEVIQEVPDTLIVHGNRNKLVQVLVNLLQNALDAVKARPSEAGPARIEIRGDSTSVEVRLIVRDNGAGIDPAIQDKIFDPFFTTKEVGEGLGLGLSISYRIVQEAGGRIEVRSRPHEFTEFILALPKPAGTPILESAHPARN